MKKYHILLCVFIMFMFVPSIGNSALNVHMYLKINGVDGDVTEKRHVDWIDIQSWVHQITVPSDRASGLPTGKRQHSPIKIVKRIDKSSRLLAGACSNGTTYDNVELHYVFEASDGSTQHYYTIKLEKCRVTSYSIGGRDDDSKPTESITLNYERIEWTYEPEGISYTDNWKN